MILAFQMLDKYKHDKAFLQKDVSHVRKQADLLTQEPTALGAGNSTSTGEKKQAVLDPTLTQEERHRMIAEKRQKRKEEAKMKEDMLREQKEKAQKEQRQRDVKKATRQRLDSLKKDQTKHGNEDIMAVFGGSKNDDSTTFLTTVNQNHKSSHFENHQNRKIEKELDDSVVQSFYQQVNDPRQSTRIQRMTETKNKIA